jgi:MFS superfamily sulfate permease-like transporter
VIFVITLLMVLATDLLVGVVCGILANTLIVLWQGAPFQQLLKLKFRLTESASDAWQLQMMGACVFLNLIHFKTILARLPVGQTLSIDLTSAPLVDHTTMAYLTDFARDYQRHGGRCLIAGLENHRPVSQHPLATRQNVNCLVSGRQRTSDDV